MQVVHSVIELLTSFFHRAVARAFPELPNEKLSVEITPSTQDTFGHYQCNSAMKLAKELKSNPRQIAQKIVASCMEDPGHHQFIQALDVAGPGFINITLNKHFLQAEVARIFLPNLGITAPSKQKIVVDFSSPNTAKEMHVGHLRSTIIGDSLAKTFEFLGHDVLRLNHIGDWGTSFGMLIAFLKRSEKGQIEDLQSMSLTELVIAYKAAKKLFDEDSAFKKQSQLEVTALQGGQKDSIAIWKVICETSRKAYQEIYDFLDVSIIERGESFYNPELSGVVADLEQKGLVQLSDGAKCIFLEGFQNREGELLPLMVQKSDGGYNYDTTDMAAIRQRTHDEKADRIIYVTDAGQATHFQMIFAAAQKAGYLNLSKVRVDHVPFGLVLGLDGKKFKTRSGDTEKLIDLLNVAVEKATAILEERNPEWTESMRKEVAKSLGIGAVKYADLSGHRLSDYTFSYERMLRFEGNTAAFLMYAYVRVLGIQRKVGVDIDDLIKNASIQIEHPSEVSLALCLARFPEVIEQVAQELLPNRLTDYLYGLAETFNVFFRDCRVEGAIEQNSRLLLTEATRRVLKQGFTLLGLKPVERM